MMRANGSPGAAFLAALIGGWHHDQFISFFDILFVMGEKTERLSSHNATFEVKLVSWKEATT
jgi:hypothetical protein